ncbi:TPA: hypothetical protein HA318_00165 [Candidatus Micrarchaeota archaeon]|nr:hypothetical protein [Candidatus Micrarchaeota archaeon]
MKLLEIKEVKAIPFYLWEKNADSIEDRLRKVPLKGLIDAKGAPVRVYSEAKIRLETLSPTQVRSLLYTPQPRVYRTLLDNVARLQELFTEAGFDNPLQLTQGYDYVAVVEDEGEELESDWTIIPPVVEENLLPVRGSLKGRIDYQRITRVKPPEITFNSALDEYDFGENHYSIPFPIICDGMHRVFSAFEANVPLNVTYITNVLQGYPYYAHPQPFNRTVVIPTREDAEKPEYAGTAKIHVFAKESEKKLYRLFPGGGIKSGDVRPDAKKT